MTNLKEIVTVSSFSSPSLHNVKKRVMDEYCYIRLDSGDEAIYHYGELIAQTMTCDYKLNLNLHLIAVRMANAANKSLRCFELPVLIPPNGNGMTLSMNLLATV
ncbi:hypothetical protein ACT2VT_000858 [Pantoea agglomerans]